MVQFAFLIKKMVKHGRVDTYQILIVCILPVLLAASGAVLGFAFCDWVIFCGLLHLFVGWPGTPLTVALLLFVPPWTMFLYGVANGTIVGVSVLVLDLEGVLQYT